MSETRPLPPPDRPVAQREAGRSAVSGGGPGLVTVHSGIPRPTASGALAAARCEMLIALCAACASLAGVLELSFSRTGPAVVNLLAAAVQFSLLEIRRRRPRWSGRLVHVCLALALASVLASAVLGRAAPVSSLLFLSGIPLVASFLSGGRTAILWTALSALALPVLVRAGPPDPASLSARTEDLLRVGIFLVTGVGTAVATRRLSSFQIDALEQREHTIQRLLKELSTRNSELAAARDTALAASRAKGDFLAVMSHEMRTPLNAVLGLAGLLLDTPLSDEQRELMATINSSGGALLTVINDILDFSKIEAGRLELERAPFDVVECAEDALEMLAQAAAEKGLDLACHVAPEVPARLEGDATRVRQILLNLVSNAIKFTQAGRVEITLDVEAGAPEGEVTIHGAVSDTGPGIEREHLDALFLPFSQVDASTTRKHGGTGLGLAICRRLAEAMGGRAWAESTPGEGSTFHFTFQAGRLDPTPAPPPAKLSALVVTPLAATRRAVTDQLERLGARTLSFATPEAAGEAGALRSPDVVIAADSLDPAAVQRLVDGDHPTGWIVLASGAKAAREAARRAWGSGPEIVSIPVRRAALARAVQRATGGAPPEPTVPPPPLRAAQRPLRVLVAEDNVVNQLVMRALLQRNGHQVDIAATGTEAVEAVGRAPYDLILMDMRMPGMDGVEATRAIRAKAEPGCNPYILALTANATSGDRDACLAAGMDGFLTKPILREELDMALESVPRRGEV